MIKLRFSVKLLLFVSVLIIGFSTVLTWFFISQSRRLLHEELKKKGFALVSNLAFVSRKGVEQANIFRNLDPLVEALIHEPDIAYVVIMNADRRVLAHNSPSEVGKIYDDQMSQGALTSTQPLLHPYSKKGEDFYDIGMAVLGGPADEFKISSAKEGPSKIERIGGVRIGISLRNLHTRMRNILWTSLTISLMLIALGIGLAYILSKGITKPIYQLVKATSQIAEGDLTVKTNIHTGDEISELSSSFDKMTENLAKTTVSRDYMDGILENLISSLIVIDQRGIIQTINRATKELLGYEEQELIGKPIGILFAKGKEEPEVEVELAGLSKESAVRNVERAYVSKDGRRIPVLFSNSAMHDANGKILGIVCVAQDITERKLAHEKLQESEKKYRDLVENMSDVIYTSDSQGRLTYLSPAIKSLTGYDPAELLGQVFFQLVHPDDLPKVMQEMPEIFKGNPIVSEVRIFTKSGELRWISASNHAVFDGEQLIGLRGILTDITERKQAEVALRESENKYRTLVENIPQKLFFKNKDSVYISCNENYAEDLKIKPDEIAGKTDYDFYPKDLAEEYRGDDKRIIELGTTEDIEERYIQNGRELWVHTVKTPIKNEKGQCIGLLGIFWDITESKKVQEALRKSEDRYRSSIELTNQMVWTTNADGEVVEDILVWRKYTGQSYEEFKGHGWSKAIHPDDVERTVQVWTKAVETKSAYETEYRIRRYDGIYRDFLARGIPVFKEDGSIQEWVGICIDITERKQAEEKIKLFSDAIASALDCFILTDVKGNITYANESFIRVFGYTHEEFLKLHISKLDADPMVAKQVMQDIAVKGKWTGEVMNIRKNKEVFPCILSAFIIKDDKGNPKGTMGILRDITERKQAEENLKKAKEEAEEANRMKSEFLANMSHEIRTPMNAIIGMTGIALDTEITSEQREYLSIVKESSYSLLRLLDDILDLSKIEAGRVELETIDFDLRATVESVADALAPRASAKGLELASLIHTQVNSLLRGDPTRLRQILINLAGNALKFTEKGEVVIQVELQKEIDNLLTLLFSVTDTGIGIPEDKQSQIFESFTQADGSTTRKYGGTGLGLSISKRLVELMGGKIGVESAHGKGSRFWFTVTLEKQKDSKEAPPSLSRPDMRDRRLLVVDDNKTNRTILVKMLESFGCVPEAVKGGAEALQVLKSVAHREKPFDLVLLDLQMPEMDGEETLRAIKNDPEIKDVPVVILTSIGERGDAARLEALGCAGYMTKPIKQSQLFDAIVTVLSQKKTQINEVPAPIVTRHTIAEQKRHKVRILVAEDNPMNLKLAVTLLEKAGYWVDAVKNGRMTIEALKRSVYDIVFMDVQMPEMDGFEATKAIREMEGNTKHTPIIAMTAHAMKGDRERCLQAGMDDYISKPIEPKEMFGAVEKWTKYSDRQKVITPDNKSKKVDNLIEAPLDIETALLRFDNDKEFFKEMLQEFLEYVPKQLQVLDEAVRKRDAKVVERAAHSLKGAAGNLSAKRIAELALKLELLGRAGDLVGAKELIDNLRTESKRLEDYLHQSLNLESALKP